MYRIDGQRRALQRARLGGCQLRRGEWILVAARLVAVVIARTEVVGRELVARRFREDAEAKIDRWPVVVEHPITHDRNCSPQVVVLASLLLIEPPDGDTYSGIGTPPTVSQWSQVRIWHSQYPPG